MSLTKIKDTELHPEQRDIILECLEKENGVLKLPMGAGKTLISLFLIKSLILKVNKYNSKIKNKEDRYETNGISLIVCSKSLIGEWENQINFHFRRNKIKYEIYYKDYVDIDDFTPKKDTEIILTTYDTLRVQYSKFPEIKNFFIRKTNTMPSITYYKCPQINEVYEPDSFLFGNQFIACFFDEVQEVSNISTGKCRACCCISSLYKWGLSGTPIKEPKPGVIFGLYTMCKLPFTDKLSETTKYLQNKKIGEGHMKYFVSREIVDLKYINIPKKRIFIEKHNVSKQEEAFINILQNLFSYYYEKTEKERKNKTERETLNTSYFTVLIYLRQACISPIIAYKSILRNYVLKTKKKSPKKIKSPSKKISPKFKDLGESLNLGEEEVQENKKNKKISPLIEEENKKNKVKSPSNKKTKSPKKEDKEDEEEDVEEDIIEEDIIEEENFNVETANMIMNKVREFGLEEYLTDDRNIKSTRFKIALGIIRKHLEDKIVIVSTSKLSLDYFYDLIQKEIPEIKLFYLKSSMTLEERNKELNDFRENKKGDAILFTYKLGSSGLNLQMANVMILLDFWWNKEESEQAIARVHRQGQKREVSIYLLTANTGIEKFLFEKQKQKKKLLELQMIGGYKQKKEILPAMSKIIYEAIKIDKNIELLKNNFNLK
jgi:SNF2 family DNA or RNA helicase